MATALAASRDQVAAAAAEHLRTLAGLASAGSEHNARLAEARARVAELGLRVRDDLVDEGQDHAEGVLDAGGLRADGTDWLPVDAGGLTPMPRGRCSAATGRGIRWPRSESTAGALTRWNTGLTGCRCRFWPTRAHLCHRSRSARAVPVPLELPPPALARRTASTATRRSAGGRHDDGRGSGRGPRDGGQQPLQPGGTAVDSRVRPAARTAVRGEARLHAERRPGGTMLRMTTPDWRRVEVVLDAAKCQSLARYLAAAPRLKTPVPPGRGLGASFTWPAPGPAVPAGTAGRQRVRCGWGGHI